MSAYLVDPEHIHVLLHAAVYRWPGQVDLAWPTIKTPSPVNSVEDRHWATVRRLTSSSMDVIGQLLVDANAASVNHRYEEDNAYVYAWQHPRHPTGPRSSSSVRSRATSTRPAKPGLADE